MKKRLDLILHERMPEYSRQHIQSWIMQGKVTVDGVVVTKPGTPVKESSNIEAVIEQDKFVSRAGFKLEKALDYFSLDVTNLVVLDAGLSTGGFTDCLLQRGARRVFGVDVGYGQVHEKIRADARVTVLERTNLRYLHTLDELVDLVTLDLSFISVLKVMDAITKLLKPHGTLVVLIKPQFEAERHQVGTGGVITSSIIHEQVVAKVIAGIESHGFQLIGVTESPLYGAAGNKEFLAYFLRL